MEKKKISICLKKKVVKKRGRPSKVVKKEDPSVGTKVYSLLLPSNKQNINEFNIIVRLKIGLSNINKLENDVNTNSLPLISNIFNKTPVASNEVSLKNLVNDDVCIKNKKNISKILKGNIPNDVIHRRDLLINKGVQKIVSTIMKGFDQNEWPCNSPYDCWYDGHPFTTAPVGIPERVINNVWHLYGNFCSYNCALRYLNPGSEDDKSRLMVNTDISEYDEKTERRQLLELLCHLETGKDLFESVKRAPCRLSLKTNGGNLSIEEFRNNFHQHKEYHMFKTPMVPIDYRIEEINKMNGYKQQLKKSFNMTKKEKIHAEKIIRNKTMSMMTMIN